MDPKSQFMASVQSPDLATHQAQAQQDVREQFLNAFKKHEELADLKDTLSRLSEHGHDINYMIKNGKYDEEALRHYTKKVHGSTIAAKASLPQLMAMMQQHVAEIPQSEAPAEIVHPFQ